MIHSAAIIAIEPNEEALLLRAHFEHLGLDVRMWRLGKPSDLFRALDNKINSVDLALLCGHGDERGFIFPELAPDIDWVKLANNRLTAQDLDRAVESVPPTIISTACGTGTSAIANAFAKAGAERFIAPDGYPNGADIPLGITALVHGVVRAQLSWKQAIARANSLVGADSQFRLLARPV
ncbi:hypothetical protein [Pelagibacterium halotolerans]|uniref:hypothetical protein n=1 Tax=Pelagibacterium halotolerans TaxID=531813 RepID=UPI00384CA5A6